MTRQVGALADRLLAKVLPKTTASAVCQPACDHHPICCRFTNTRFKWRVCTSTCYCYWSGDC
jgi:hypothetical protein